MGRKEQGAIVLLRIAVGWHFLYEGLVKFTDPSFSAESYLKGSEGMMRYIYEHYMHTPVRMFWVDTLNITALLLVGTGLFFGVAIRKSAYLGMLLLFFYYSAYPPFSGADSVGGSFFIVDRNLIEFLVLFLIAQISAAQDFSISKAWSVGTNRELNSNNGK
ncbi:MAG: DoxX family membrane protein [Bacteroidales bacterium]